MGKIHVCYWNKKTYLLLILLLSLVSAVCSRSDTAADLPRLAEDKVRRSISNRDFPGRRLRPVYSLGLQLSDRFRDQLAA